MVLQLISPGSVNRAEGVLAEYRSLTGNLSNKLQTADVSGQIIECLHVSSCMSGTTCWQLPHRHEVVAEISLEGEELDACLLLFIRRVLQEGASAEAAPDLLGARFYVAQRQNDSRTNRSTAFSFAPSDMQSGKRQAILSSLKAATVDGGNIWLESYMFSTRMVPAHSKDSAHLSQHTSGLSLIHI